MGKVILISINIIFLFYTILHIDSISWKPFIGLNLLNTLMFLIISFMREPIYNIEDILSSFIAALVLTGVVTAIVAIFYFFFI